MWRIYNYYLPILLLLFLAVEKLYVWMLFALGFLLVTISCNLQALVAYLSEKDRELRQESVEDGPDKLD